MERVTNGEELRQRLVQAAGEDVAAFGWGTLGMSNVLVGATPSALVLEFVTMGMRTREIRRIPYEELEFIYAFSGDASTPKLLKMNLEARIADSMTGTLMLKPSAEGILNITFRKIPRHDRNDRAPFRVIEQISSVIPEKVYLPDLKEIREKPSFEGCLRSFLLIAAVASAVLMIALALITGEWELSIFGGLGTGVVLGAVFAPLAPVFKRIVSGRG